jgi:mono/diheme cytochrome c family protein
VPESVEGLAEARAHFADHCASCHANNGSGLTPMGQNLYPKAPDMRLADTQGLSDGEIFYVIQNGVRFTGMPAWGSGTPEDEKDSWNLVRFIRHLPSQTPEEIEEMKQLNPKTREELREEEEIRKFLEGGEAASTPQLMKH